MLLLYYDNNILLSFHHVTNYNFWQTTFGRMFKRYILTDLPEFLGIHILVLICNIFVYDTTKTLYSRNFAYKITIS